MFSDPPAPRRQQFIISDHYFEALSKLDGNQTVRVKANNTGLATRCWHRFEVAFMDAFTRNEKAKATEKARSWDIFKQQLTERFAKSANPLTQKQIDDAVTLHAPSTEAWLTGRVANLIVNHLNAQARLQKLGEKIQKPPPRPAEASRDNSAGITRPS